MLCAVHCCRSPASEGKMYLLRSSPRMLFFYCIVSHNSHSRCVCGALFGLSSLSFTVADRRLHKQTTLLLSLALPSVESGQSQESISVPSTASFNLITFSTRSSKMSVTRLNCVVIINCSPRFRPFPGPPARPNDKRHRINTSFFRFDPPFLQTWHKQPTRIYFVSDV